MGSSQKKIGTVSTQVWLLLFTYLPRVDVAMSFQCCWSLRPVIIMIQYRSHKRIRFVFSAMNHLDEIVKCMQLFSSSSETEFDKKDFARAVRAVTGINLTPTQVDVVFGVFDRYVEITKIFSNVSLFLVMLTLYFLTVRDSRLLFYLSIYLSYLHIKVFPLSFPMRHSSLRC